MQHHHAHLASCLADNGEAGPVVGLACDGLGYGTDGALWGGEVHGGLARPGSERLAHLEEVALPGGATAIRQPWRMAAAWLRAAGIDGADLAVARRNPGWATVGRLLDSRRRRARDDERRAAVRRGGGAGRDARRRELRGPGGDRAGAGGGRVGARVVRASRQESVRECPVRGEPAATRPGPRAACCAGRTCVRGVVADLRAGRRRPGDRRPVPRRPRRPARPRGRATPAPRPASTPSPSPAASSRTCCCCGCSSPSWRPPGSGCSPTPACRPTTRA